MKDIKNEDMDDQDEDQYELLRLEMEKKESVGKIGTGLSEKEDDSSYKSKTKYLFNLLILAILSLVLTFIILANIDYNNKINQSDNIYTLYDALDYSHRRTSEIQNILSNIREIYLVNYGLFGDPKSSSAQKKMNNSITRIYKSLEVIKKVQNLLVSRLMFELIPENQILNTQAVAKIYYQDNTSIPSDLDKGVQLFYAVAFDLINNNLSAVTMDNPKVYFLEFNMFNQFWSILMESTNNFVSKIRSMSDFSALQIQYQVIFSCIFFFLVLIYSGFFHFMLMQIKRPKHELLNNFLRIQDYVITFYQNRCEMFLLFLAAEESLDELNNSMDEDDDDQNLLTTSLFMMDTHKRIKGESEDDGISGKKKVKKAKYQKSNMSLFVFLIVFIGIVFAYFFIAMNVYSTLMKQLNINLDEFNVTSLTETYFYFTDNAQRYFVLIYIFISLLS